MVHYSTAESALSAYNAALSDWKAAFIIGGDLEAIRLRMNESWSDFEDLAPKRKAPRSTRNHDQDRTGFGPGAVANDGDVVGGVVNPWDGSGTITGTASWCPALLVVFSQRFARIF